MASEAILRIKVIADTANAALGLDQASGKFGKFGAAMKRAALPAAAIVGAIGAGAKAAIDAASDYQQAQGAVEAVFGRQAKAVEQLSKTSADRLGLAGSAYLNYAALIGASLQNAGFSTEQAVRKQDVLMTRAADMAATYGGSTADAVEAINAAVARGEFDPLEKYAVSLNMTAVNAELAKRGQDNLTGAALKHAKAQVTLEMLMNQTSKAAGQFARESDTAAGQQQRAAAAATDAAASLGQSLLPAYTKLMQVGAQFANWANKNRTIVLALAAVLGVLAVAVLAVNAAMWVMAANPVVLTIVAVVAAVALLVAGLVILYKRSETFRNAVNATWAAVRAGAQLAARVVMAVWRVVWTALSTYVRVYVAVVRAVFSAIRAVSSAVASFTRAAWSKVWAAVSAYVRAYANVVRAVFNAVRGAANAVASFVRNVWTRTWAAVVNAARTVGRGIVAALNSARAGAVAAAAAIRSRVASAFTSLIGVAQRVGSALVAPFRGVASVIESIIGAVNRLISALSRIRVPKISLPRVPGLRAAPAAPVARYAAPGVLSRGVPASGAVPLGSVGAGVVINVYGAVDPEGVARQIKKYLAGHDVRVGRAGVGTGP